jgi:hypothetical protein
LNAEIAKLRENMFNVIALYPRNCCSFVGLRTMEGTAFFPGGDGLWKSNDNIDPILPRGGVLFIGSDWGDRDSYEKVGEGNAVGSTWKGLIKIVDRAKIPRHQIFSTNAWPCLRAGGRAVGGTAPGSKDPEFTSRCKVFFLHTIELMRPKVVVPLGILPTSFVASLTPAEPSPWAKVSSWTEIDSTPIWQPRDFDFKVVPIVHPSMPNRRHRQKANTMEAEADLISSAFDS